jgi:hypothetical protein
MVACQRSFLLKEINQIPTVVGMTTKSVILNEEQRCEESLANGREVYKLENSNQDKLRHQKGLFPNPFI